MRRMSRREGNLHFFPDRIEAIAGDSVNHRNKRCASGQTRVRLVDEVEGCVVLKDSLFSGRREFHEQDVEQLGVVIGGHYAATTVRAASPFYRLFSNDGAKGLFREYPKENAYWLFVIGVIFTRNA